MRIENEQQNEARMEIHFPHLTNGIAPVRPTRRQRAKTFRKLAISSAIALAAVVGVIGASSANAMVLYQDDAQEIIANGNVLNVDDRITVISYVVIHKGRLHHCHSMKSVKDDGLRITCRFNK